MSTFFLLVCLSLAPSQTAGAPSGDRRPFMGRSAPETVSLLGRPLFGPPPGADMTKLEADLRRAEELVRESPGDPDRIVWIGRRLGYLWRMTDAIETYSRGIERFPKYAPLYRHRGHRYITVRKFDLAIADLETAARLISGQEDTVEQDGIPNARNIPLTTLHFNVWYHLGVARYVSGDFTGALDAFESCKKCRGEHDDNLVAVTDWMYMTLRRLDRDEEAAKLLEPIHAEMEIIENRAYHRRLLMYKGALKPEQLLDVRRASDLDLATMGYGVGNWYLCEGDRAKAIEIFGKVTAGSQWPAFGFIAAEADLARMRQRDRPAMPRE